MAMWQETTTRIHFPKLGTATVFLFGALHFLAALSLAYILLTLNPAKAGDDVTCGGKNLLNQMKQDDPATYAKIVEEGTKLENGNSIFWKLTKGDLKPSYLLGTMHMSDPRVLAMPAGAKEAFAASDTLIVESDEILDQQKASAKIMEKPDLMMFTDGKSITDYLTPDEKTMMDTELKKRGIPLFSVAKMKPWVVSSFVALPSCELARKAKGAPFLDMKLTQDAAASGKAIKGLETLQEQLQAMASLSVEFHVKGLISTLKYADKTNDLMETMIELYLDGKPGWIKPLSMYAFPEADGEAFSMAEFEQKMITSRNHNMADRAKETMDKGNAFMAVGALHLPGKDGLIELFRAQGFTATPVNAQ